MKKRQSEPFAGSVWQRSKKGFMRTLYRSGFCLQGFSIPVDLADRLTSDTEESPRHMGGAQPVNGYGRVQTDASQQLDLFVKIVEPLRKVQRGSVGIHFPNECERFLAGNRDIVKSPRIVYAFVLVMNRYAGRVFPRPDPKKKSINPSGTPFLWREHCSPAGRSSGARIWIFS